MRRSSASTAAGSRLGTARVGAAGPRPPLLRPLARVLPWAPLLLVAPLAHACAGGGGGPTAPGGPSVAQAEATSFQLVNQARQQAGVPLLQLDPALSAVARAHSEAMRDRGFFGHDDPVTGKSFLDRLLDAGQPFRTAGENLATTTHAADPAGFAHANLFASPEHRAEILDPAFDRVGVGVARSGDSYWFTQLFVGD
jgi:uncharacterized protein YkwD